MICNFSSDFYQSLVSLKKSGEWEEATDSEIEWYVIEKNHFSQ